MVVIVVVQGLAREARSGVPPQVIYDYCTYPLCLYMATKRRAVKVCEVEVDTDTTV